MQASPSADIIGELAQVVGCDSVLIETEDLVPYSFDGTAGPRQLPAAVVFPRTTAQVSGCVRAAAARTVPIVTRGSGTGLSGGSVPTPGAVVLCLARLGGHARHHHLFDAWEMKSISIEEAREASGLSIVAAWMLVIVVAQRQGAGKKS